MVFFTSAELKRRVHYQEPSANAEIPYLAPIDDHTFITREGDYVCTFRLRGRTFESTETVTLYAWRDQFNLLIRQIGSEHLTLMFHIDHHASDEYPEGEIPHGFAQDLERRYREDLAQSTLYVNDLYVSLIYRPSPDRVRKTISLIGSMSPTELKRLQQNALRELKTIALMFQTKMEAYTPTLLGVYTHNDIVFSEALEFYHYLLTGERTRFPLVRANIQDVLMTSRPIFSDGIEVGELRGAGSSTFVGALGIQDYVPKPLPGHFDKLLSLPFPFILAQTFRCLSRAEARSQFHNRGIRLNQAEDDSVTEIDQIAGHIADGAKDKLARNMFIMGEYCLTFIAKSSRSSDIPDALIKATTVFSDAGFIMWREELGVEAAFWSLLPGNGRYLLRPTLISSLNLASFVSLHNHPRGNPKNNHWGKALMLLRTGDNGPYFFNLHQKDVGHTAIFGPTTSGKTVLQGMIAAMLRKREYAAKQFFFDYGRGAEIFIRAMGGRYLSLKDTEQTGFNPFSMDPSPKNILLVQRLLHSFDTMAGLPREEEKDLDRAVARVFELEKKDRRLSALLLFVNRNESGGIADRLEKWVDEKRLGWFMDNETDTIDLSGEIVGFDMTNFLDNPQTCLPSMMYLFYRISELTGRVVMAIDEFWKALDYSYFQEQLKTGYNVDRKRDRLFITSTQSISAAAKSPIARSIIEQTGRGTQIFFPNDQADRNEYVGTFNLTSREFDLVRETPSSSRKFLVKQGSQSALVQLDLGRLSDDRVILSGTEESVKKLDSLRAEVGDDPKVWIPLLIKWAKNNQGRDFGV